MKTETLNKVYKQWQSHYELLDADILPDQKAVDAWQIVDDLLKDRIGVELYKLTNHINDRKTCLRVGKLIERKTNQTFLESIIEGNF